MLQGLEALPSEARLSLGESDGWRIMISGTTEARLEEGFDTEIALSINTQNKTNLRHFRLRFGSQVQRPRTVAKMGVLKPLAHSVAVMD